MFYIIDKHHRRFANKVLSADSIVSKFHFLSVFCIIDKYLNNNSWFVFMRIVQILFSVLFCSFNFRIPVFCLMKKQNFVQTCVFGFCGIVAHVSVLSDHKASASLYVLMRQNFEIGNVSYL